MSAPVPLERLGLRLYHAILRLDDYLWFASSERSAVVETETVLHNYALAYALNGPERAIEVGAAPHYTEDLKDVPLYPTPATPMSPSRRTTITYNAVDERTLLTDLREYIGKRNEPNLGQKRVIEPGARFRFYVFARGDAVAPRVFRLGKKRSPVCLERLDLLASAVARETSAEPTHPLNPLDVSGRIVAYRPVAVPPHLLLDAAWIEDGHFVEAKAQDAGRGRGLSWHRVNVPRRFLDQA
jgi:CRISPR-associated protein Csc1